MKRILFAAIALAAVQCAFASNWRVIVVIPGETTVFADEESIVRVGSRVKVWSWWWWNSQRPAYTAGKPPYRTEKNLHIFDCNSRQAGLIGVLTYVDDKAIDPSESMTGSESKAQMADVPPDTVYEKLLTWACSKH